MTELEKQIQVVATARQIAYDAGQIKLTAKLKWEAENKAIIDDASQSVEDVAIEEAKLRALTVAIFKETGEKKPAPEVGIREVEKLIYDNNLAMYWAKEHSLALKLDSAAFENIVKASPADFASFVKIEKVPTATIATKIEIKQEGV